jgi:hypothetical protein
MKRIVLALCILTAVALPAFAAVRNVYVTMGAADDGAAINTNESSKGVDMTNAEKARFAAQGTFGGGTMTLQVTLDGTNWSTSGLTLTANGSVELTTPCKQARWTLTGATSPSITMGASIRTLQ